MLTWEATDPGELNRVFGTSLTPTDYKIMRPSPQARYVFNHVAARNKAHEFQKVCWLYRLMRRKKTISIW